MKANTQYPRHRLGWWLRVPCAAPTFTLLVRLCVVTGAISGCSGDRFGLGKTVPVVGKVHVTGQPLRLGNGAFGKVWFQPDVAKGNQCPQIPFAAIDEEGTYTLFTRGQEGAPTGWYKVMVVATEQIDPAHPSKRRKSFCNQKYGAAQTSGLAVEVVSQPHPGAYDLHLTR